MKKKTSLSAKLIAAFMAAILGSVLICALLTHTKQCDDKSADI